MHFSKNLQYAVSGVLAIYIVFFTRPAPQMVVRMLSSPIAQLAALAGIVYVGASVSLLVALVSAVALVLSIPAREYLTVEKDEEKKKKSEEAEKPKNLKKDEDEEKEKAAKALPPKDAAKKAEPAGAASTAETAASSAMDILSKNTDKTDVPAMPASHPVANAPASGKEEFAPF